MPGFLQACFRGRIPCLPASAYMHRHGILLVRGGSMHVLYPSLKILWTHSNMSIRLLHHHLLDWPQRPPSSTLSLVLRIKLQSGPPEQQPSIRTLNRVVRKGEVSHFFVLASPCSLFYFNVCSSDGLLMRIHVASPCYLLVQKLT